MRSIFANLARKSIFLGVIYAISFINITFAAERNLCGTVSKADVSESGDMLFFSVKQGKKKEEFSIYIEDEAMKYSELIWGSFRSVAVLRMRNGTSQSPFRLALGDNP